MRSNIFDFQDVKKFEKSIKEITIFCDQPSDPNDSSDNTLENVILKKEEWNIQHTELEHLTNILNGK